MKNLWVKYEDSDWILRDVSFKAEKGQLIVVAGESGSGKTTLARTLAGLIPNFYRGEVKGEIDIFGANPLRDGLEKLHGVVGFLGQDPSLYTIAINVREEIIYPLEILGLDRRSIKERLNTIINFFSLKKLVDRSLIELSSGELQRVEIAAIYAQGPNVYILDEPLARLDPPSARKISLLLREIANNDKIVLVFEHHLDEILPLSDRVIVLSAGKIIFDGSPRQALPYLADIDLPEISEIFIELGCDPKQTPLTIDEVR